MATSTTPVVLSRIQNRIGTQSEFNALYPVYPGTGTQVLKPGEIALCTDTRRIFVGNLGGEYIEVGASMSGGSSSSAASLQLAPLLINLPAQAAYTEIPVLSYSPTSFLSLWYSISDSGTSSAPGIHYAKNGEFKITAIDYTPGYPVTVNLVDEGTEINTTTSPVSAIDFKAAYSDDRTHIVLSYKHNFPYDLTLSTSTVIWQPL